MGTNFYFMGEHVGKQSAAGLYCWNCHETLCKDGKDGIHKGKSEWHEACPKCGLMPKSWKEREPMKGISTVCSFTWAMEPEVFQKKLKSWNRFRFLWKLGIFENPLKDEYGGQIENFSEVLKYAPIQFRAIGESFS